MTLSKPVSHLGMDLDSPKALSVNQFLIGALSHLMSQKRQARKRGDKNSSSCEYLTAEGDQCAIGCFLDRETALALNHIGDWRSVEAWFGSNPAVTKAKALFAKIPNSLIRKVQDVHDFTDRRSLFFKKQMAVKIAALAEEFGAKRAKAYANGVLSGIELAEKARRQKSRKVKAA